MTLTQQLYHAESRMRGALKHYRRWAQGEAHEFAIVGIAQINMLLDYVRFLLTDPAQTDARRLAEWQAVYGRRTA